VTARTQTAIADVEELLDLLQTQSDALSALDELESVDSIVRYEQKLWIRDLVMDVAYLPA